MTEGGSAGESRRIVYLIAVMTVVALTVGGLAIGTLYDAAFEEQRQRLIETAQSRARLMEAVARFDAVYSQDYPHGARQATISQVVDRSGSRGVAIPAAAPDRVAHSQLFQHHCG